MNAEFEAELRSQMTGKSYNTCLDELWEEQQSLQQRQDYDEMADAERKYYEALEAQIEKDN